MIEKTIKLLSHQYKFINSKTFKTVLIAGRGSGKSFVSLISAISHTLAGHNVIFVCPTYGLIKKSVSAEIINLLNDLGVKYKYNKSDLILNIYHHRTVNRIVFVSAENPERLRGLTGFSKLYIDEAAICCKDCLDLGVACLRGKGVYDPQVYMMSTPRGYGNWLSQEYDKPDVTKINAKTSDNKHNGEHFESILKETYSFSESFYRQEVLGEIVDSSSQGLYNDGDWRTFVGTCNTPNTSTRYVAGLDIAGSGDDSTVLTIRQGNTIVKIYKLNSKVNDQEQIINLVRLANTTYPIYAIRIDSTGIGSFIPGVLKNTFKKMIVIPCNFAEKSSRDAYANKRAEIHYELKKMIVEKGLHILPSAYDNFDRVKAEFFGVEIFLNNQRQLQLTPKDKFKANNKYSPDELDSICLSCFDDEHQVNMYNKAEEINRLMGV
jgi:PBSX family phage terminase large subunit